MKKKCIQSIGKLKATIRSLFIINYTNYIRILSFSIGQAQNHYDYMTFQVRQWFTYGSFMDHVRADYVVETVLLWLTWVFQKQKCILSINKMKAMQK